MNQLQSSYFQAYESVGAMSMVSIPQIVLD